MIDNIKNEILFHKLTPDTFSTRDLITCQCNL